jgi:hypothetical protein
MTTTGVFLPDEQEQQIAKKPPQSVRTKGDGIARTELAKPASAHSEYAKLNEHQLKAAIKTEWKKHEESAKQDLAPLLYYLREQLRAQGARNDLSVVEKDRGFAAWVEENLDITRRTADRWCEWFADEAGFKQNSTSRHVSRSDVDLWHAVQDEDEEDQQIAFNYSVPKALHAKYTTAVAKLQKAWGLKNKKEAVVQGVIYAAKNVGRAKGKVSLVSRATKKSRHQPVAHGPHRHRGGSGLRVAKAAAGR